MCPDPNGHGGCACLPSRSQVPGQWLGHPYSGPSTLFANGSTMTPSPFAFSQFPSTTLHHAPHEPNEFCDPHNHHGTQGYSNIQHPVFPHTSYNTNPHSPNPPSQIHCYQPSPNATPRTTQGVSSPSNRRKCKNNMTGQGGTCKCQQQPAPIVTAPTSAICGVGPSTSIILSSNLPDNDAPSSLPPLSTITVQPTSDSLPTTSASTRLPSASYSSLRENQPANLPSPDQDVVLKMKPRSQFVSCKLCKYASSFFTLHGSLHICIGCGKFIEIQMVSQQQCETISNYGITKNMRG